MKKRVLALLLAAALLLGAWPLSAAARTRPAFSDVPAGKWYTHAVEWAVENGITAGVTETEFCPKQVLTRAQLVTFLWNLSGKEQAPAHPFPDVPRGKWYEPAVNWAVENGLVAGYPDGTFGGKLPATREQMAVLLYRWAALRGDDPPGFLAEAPTFPDSAGVGKFARQAVAWAVSRELLAGNEEGFLDPKGPATRAQLVSILYRWMSPWVEKDVAVARVGETLQKTGTQTLRFYAEAPHVATISVKDFYALMNPGHQLTVQPLSHGVYVLVSATGAAQVDVNRDTLSSWDLLAFTNLMGRVQEGLANVYCDGLPYARVAEVSCQPATAPVELDYGAYGVDLIGEEEDVYFPLATLSNLFSNLYYHFADYNGKTLYLYDNNLAPSFAKSDPAFSDPLLRGKQRPTDLVRYTYADLCFTVDHYYGRSGRGNLDADLETLTLQAALEGRGETGQRVMALLRSTDPADYHRGLTWLHSFLYDGGHTSMVASRYLDTSRPGGSELDRLEDETLKDPACLALRQKTFSLREEANAGKEVRRQLRAAAYGEGVTYAAKGDTAVVLLDDFYQTDLPGWKAYYAGRGSYPVKEDSFGTFLSALKQAQADPEIRTLVIDISNNRGGSLDMVAAVMAFMGCTPTFRYRNLLTGQDITYTYQVDCNLDGRFDAADEAYQPRLRFSVVTSQASFSCGNLFPAMVKEQGIPLLGEVSGGGGNALQQIVTGDGLQLQISSAQAKLLNAAGESIEWGAPVEVDLVRRTPQGDKDYSAFVDLETLARLTAACYAS